MSKKIKVAIIGCGAIANSAHIPAYMKNEKAEIKYFCDIIPERADAAVEKYGCGKAVYDYHEILDDPELDSVSVCTHNDLHSILSGHAFGTIRELAAEASRRGLSLIGVTEHAPGIPGTVDPIYFRNLCDAPRELYGVEMLYGSEVNVLNGGELSLDQRHLNYLDYAIAGIHGLCYEDAGAVKNTDNVIRCMENPKVKIISHPDTDQYPMDYPALVEGAKEFGVALELNNSSLRKPKSRLNCVENYRKMIPLCMERGVFVVVDTDAHDPSAVGNFDLARKLLETMDINEELILNNDLQKLKKFLLDG